MDKQEKIFAKGIYFDKPREGSPDFVKGRISVNVAEFIEFAKKHEKKSGYINLDLKKSKEGKLYLELNTWTPKEKVENITDEEAEKKLNELSDTSTDDSINPSDIPF